VHPTKVAAVLALIVALVASFYLCILLYEDVFLHKPEITALNNLSVEVSGKGTRNDEWDNLSQKYFIFGGIAVAVLITSRALFGATKQKQGTS
jgi:hypothetical protein